MSVLKYMGLAIFALGISSCATSNKIDYDAISARIQSGEKAGVISTFKPSGSRIQGIGKDLLLSASMKIENVETDETKTIYFGKSGRVQQIEPGTYKVKYGNVRGPNVTGTMPLLAFWVEDFEVSGGEIVDLGELNMNRIKINVKTDGVGKTFNALMSLGTDINDDQTHTTYEIEPSSQSDLKKAVSKFPKLESRIVSRPLEMRFTEADFRDAIQAASARKANGKLPSRQDVRRNLEFSLLRLFMQSKLDEMKTEP